MDGTQIPSGAELTRENFTATGRGERHGDTLTTRLPAPAALRELLSDELCEKVANALRFMGMQAQIRRESAARQFYDDAARLFNNRK